MSFFEIDLDRKRIPTTTATIKTKNPSQQGRRKEQGQILNFFKIGIGSFRITEANKTYNKKCLRYLRRNK